MRLRRATLFAVLTVACGVWIGGCGSSNTATHDGTGIAAFTIAWPTAATRLIPSASNSVVIALTDGDQPVATQTAARPSTGSQSTVTFDDLPVGQLTATATAFPSATGTGTAQAGATLTLTIQKDQTTTTPLSLTSTIASFLVEASRTQLNVGETATLTATAKNANGDLVLIPTVGWSASPSGLVSLATARQSQQQVLTAAAAGQVTVTGAFQESIGDATTARSAEVAVTITQPAFSKVAPASPEHVVVQRANSAVGTIAGRQLTMVGAPDISGVDAQQFSLSAASGSPAGLSSVNVRAAYDASNIYFQLDWADDTANTVRGPLHMDPATGAYTRGSDNEDRVALVFDIAGDATGLGGAFAQNGCTVTCHGDNLMRTTTGTLDNWHVKMARSVPSGYSDDSWWDSTDRRSDTGSAASSNNAGVGNVPNFLFNGSASLGGGLLRKTDGAAPGGDATAAAVLYAKNCAGCHGQQFQGGTGPALADVARTRSATTLLGKLNGSMDGFRGAAAAEDWVAFLRGLVDVPREVLQPPSGSRADVRAAAAHANGRWTVVLWRSLAATSPTEDATFNPSGGTMPFSLAVMNNDGPVHAGAAVGGNFRLQLQFAP